MSVLPSTCQNLLKIVKNVRGCRFVEKSRKTCENCHHEKIAKKFDFLALKSREKTFITQKSKKLAVVLWRKMIVAEKKCEKCCHFK